MSKLKLIYFAAAARAETSRLLLTLGDVAFEDVRIAREDWPDLKPSTPFGQIPMLEVDGQKLAQSHAIELYCSKVAGLEPSNPLQAAKSFSYAMLCADLWQHMGRTWMMPLEERIAVRQELLAGPVHDILARMDAHLGALEDGQYIAGTAEPTLGDVAIFVSLCSLINGMMDGIPLTLLDKYSNLKAFRHKVASLPKVKAYYEGRAEQLNVASYKAFTPDYPN